MTGGTAPPTEADRSVLDAESDGDDEDTGTADRDGTGPDASDETAPRVGPTARRLSDWDAARLRDVAADHGTPTYVLDLDRVRENYRRLSAAFPEARVHFAAKANTGVETLRALRREGAGVEVASPGELRAVMDAGFAPSRIHYTAVNPPADDLDRLLSHWRDGPAMTVTVGAADTLDRLVERGYDGRIAVRVNPAVGAGHHEKVATGNDAQFGVPADRADEVVARARRHCRFVGIHAHIGSGILNDGLDRYRRAMERVGELARRLEPLEFVDVGGGFGVPYHPEEDPLDLAAAADVVREALAGVDATTVIEPGRYLVADAGVLLSRVNTRKEAPDAVVAGIDASLATNLRPALFDAYHPIRNLAPDADDRPTEGVTVGGPVCSSADTFCTGRPLARPERGDPLAIGIVGAYGYELANRFHRRRLPAEVAIDGDEVRVTRRREEFADVERPERRSG